MPVALHPQEFSIGPEQIDALYHYAKFQFECGNYSAAAEFLYHYRTLSTDNERNMSALWGKLAAEILLQNWCVPRPGGAMKSSPDPLQDLGLRDPLHCVSLQRQVLGRRGLSTGRRDVALGHESLVFLKCH